MFLEKSSYEIFYFIKNNHQTVYISFFWQIFRFFGHLDLTTVMNAYDYSIRSNFHCLFQFNSKPSCF